MAWTKIFDVYCSNRLDFFYDIFLSLIIDDLSNLILCVETNHLLLAALRDTKEKHTTSPV